MTYLRGLLALLFLLAEAAAGVFLFGLLLAAMWWLFLAGWTVL